VPELAVRRAKTGDTPAIAYLYIEVVEEVVPREPALRHVPAGAGVERRYRSRIDHPDRAVLVAVADGSVIGFVDAVLQRHETKRPTTCRAWTPTSKS
jgi:hypothetical protein